MPPTGPRAKVWFERRLIAEHAFDKLRLIDCLFSEFSAACDAAEVIEETAVSGGVKELLLTVAWKRPLHVVVIVDEVRQEDRVVTVYEPDPSRWSSDYRRRR
ncbi:MAG: hypothetical protein H0T70_09350 [Acidimicrobiia bacterium]|nr:hypothetical protein [Acidimicrobiia bacterium]